MTTAFQTKYASETTRISELLAAADELSADILAEAALTDSTDSFPANAFKNLTETGLLKAVFPKK